MNHRNPRVTRWSDDVFEVVIPGQTNNPRHEFVLDHIEAHMLYVKLAIAFGYTTEAVEQIDPRTAGEQQPTTMKEE